MRLSIVMMLGVLLLAGPGRAQDAAPDAGFSAGLRALEAGQIDDAIDLFEVLVEDEPAYMVVGKGSAAYWLGRAYEADDDLESTREVWTEGLEAFNEALRFDPRLADAFIRLTFTHQHGTEYPLAGREYLRLLESLDWYPYTGDEVALPLDHLKHLTLVLPDALQREIGLDRVEKEGLAALSDEAGARLRAWWRSRDVAPASRNNERVEEHLRRVVYAQAKYADGDDYDDRGRVYIRLGEPSHTTTVSFDNLSFRTKVIDRSLTLHMSDFPQNEFWVYEHVDEAAQFLFYETGGRYRLGEIRDLLPSVLRTGIGSSERGKSKARALVRSMDEIYRQLSLYHPNFATIYQDVASFAGLLDEADFVAESISQFQAERQNEQQEGGDESLPQEVRDALSSGNTGAASVSMPGSIFSAERPDLFAKSILNQAHIEDEQAMLQRQEYVPQTHSNAFDDTDPLRTVARLARFLDDDGTTRTELYWGVPPGALQPTNSMRKAIIDQGYEPKDYLLLTTVVQKAEAYQERVVNYRRHLLRDLEDAGDAAMPPQTYIAQGDTGLYHVAMQWDQYTATLDDNGQPMVLGLRVKANTFRADSLRALNNDPATLEMSDLKPMIVLDAGAAARAENLADVATLYPFDRLEKQTPLLLYFEVYHLTFDAADQTQYTVAYEVESVEKGGLLRFLDGSRGEGTSAQTDYTGSSRTAREYILIDFSEWEGRGALVVTVRITDRVTGREVERTMPLTLVKQR